MTTVQASVLRPLLWSVLFTVESELRRMRDVRELWVPESLRRALKFGSKAATDDSKPGDRWWRYQWGGILSQPQFDELRESCGLDYEGPGTGMIGAPGWRGLVPDLRWCEPDEYVQLSALPFPADLDTDEKRASWNGADWDDIVREFEAYQAVLAAREEEAG